MTSEEQAILRVIEHVDARLKEHRDDSHKRHNELVDVIKSGFPGGDPEAHRRAHEALIAREIWRQEFRNKISEHLAEKGIWALFAGISTLVWYGVQLVLNKGPH